MSDLVGLLVRLSRGGVEYVLVGGLAAAVHGTSIVTQDVDVCIRLTPENWELLRKAIADLEPVHRMGMKPTPFANESGLFERLQNAYLTTRWGQLDALGEISGVGPFETVLAASITLQIEDVEVRVLGLEALKTAKKAVGRQKDLETVRQLERIQKLGPQS